MQKRLFASLVLGATLSSLAACAMHSGKPQTFQAPSRKLSLHGLSSKNSAGVVVAQPAAPLATSISQKTHTQLEPRLEQQINKAAAVAMQTNEPASWKVQSNVGTVIPKRGYRQGNRICREFIVQMKPATSTPNMKGVACQTKTGWMVEHLK